MHLVYSENYHDCVLTNNKKSGECNKVNHSRQEIYELTLILGLELFMDHKSLSTACGLC